MLISLRWAGHGQLVQARAGIKAVMRSQSEFQHANKDEWWLAMEHVKTCLAGSNRQHGDGIPGCA